MNDVIFIGNRLDVAGCRQAGIPGYVPGAGLLAERVLAERARCRVLAMTEDTFDALPADLARELRESDWPRLAIVPDLGCGTDRQQIRDVIARGLSPIPAAVA